MGEIINTQASWFEQWKQERESEGWRVVWDDERGSNICYAPDGSEAFDYDMFENKYGAWAYLTHYLSKDNGT